MDWISWDPKYSPRKDGCALESPAIRRGKAIMYSLARMPRLLPVNLLNFIAATSFNKLAQVSTSSPSAGYSPPGKPNRATDIVTNSIISTASVKSHQQASRSQPRLPNASNFRRNPWCRYFCAYR
ncbi:hypothetical protein FRC16_006602 [Serendipita sp. 398]|nr:hypothetical protein FRC16_006602 [Serendipita sp. 398]